MLCNFFLAAFLTTKQTQSNFENIFVESKNVIIFFSFLLTRGPTGRIKRDHLTHHAISHVLPAHVVWIPFPCSHVLPAHMVWIPCSLVLPAHVVWIPCSLVLPAHAVWIPCRVYVAWLLSMSCSSTSTWTWTRAGEISRPCHPFFICHTKLISN